MSQLLNATDMHLEQAIELYDGRVQDAVNMLVEDVDNAIKELKTNAMRSYPSDYMSAQMARAAEEQFLNAGYLVYRYINSSSVIICLVWGSEHHE